MAGRFRFVWNIPNALSLLRLVLLPLFVWLYLTGDIGSPRFYGAIAALLISGLSDMLDGWVARRWNQITECGKLLDPVADKLTQFVVLICVAIRYQEVWILVGICFCKELLQLIGAALLLGKGDNVRGARWFGKVYTCVFYAAMATIVMVPNLPNWALWSLTGSVVLVMVLALAGYVRDFVQVRRGL